MTSIYLTLMFLFYHIYAYLELTPFNYFPTFAIKFLRWPVKDVSLLMSVFFGTNFAARFLGVPLSFVLHPRTMIIINLCLTMIAVVILLAVQSVPELLWASAAMLGIGMATILAATMLWTAEKMVISGRVASILVAGWSSGNVFHPQIVGRLFDVPAAGGPMSMVYVTVTAALLLVALFICMMVFVARCRVDHHPTDLRLQETVYDAPASTRTAVEVEHLT